MHGAPTVSDTDYSEGFAPAPFNWDDRARVIRSGVKVTTKAGTYNDVIVTQEFNIQEAGMYQTKYYAPGVGVVKVGWGGKDDTQEDLELVKVAHLTGADLDRARASALVLDARAATYGGLEPATQR